MTYKARSLYESRRKPTNEIKDPEIFEKELLDRIRSTPKSVFSHIYNPTMSSILKMGKKSFARGVKEGAIRTAFAGANMLINQYSDLSVSLGIDPPEEKDLLDISPADQSDLILNWLSLIEDEMGSASDDDKAKFSIEIITLTKQIDDLEIRSQELRKLSDELVDVQTEINEIRIMELETEKQELIDEIPFVSFDNADIMESRIASVLQPEIDRLNDLGFVVTKLELASPPTEKQLQDMESTRLELQNEISIRQNEQKALTDKLFKIDISKTKGSEKIESLIERLDDPEKTESKSKSKPQSSFFGSFSVPKSKPERTQLQKDRVMAKFNLKLQLKGGDISRAQQSTIDSFQRNYPDEFQDLQTEVELELESEPESSFEFSSIDSDLGMSESS